MASDWSTHWQSCQISVSLHVIGNLPPTHPAPKSRAILDNIYDPVFFASVKSSRCLYVFSIKSTRLLKQKCVGLVLNVGLIGPIINKYLDGWARVGLDVASPTQENVL